MQNVEQWRRYILERALNRIEKDFGLSKAKLLPLEIAALSSVAKKVADGNARLSKELQMGVIDAKTYDENVMGAPDYEVFAEFCRSYGQAPDVKFINRLKQKDRENYSSKILRPALLAARRERIKPFLPDENDVLE